MPFITALFKNKWFWIGLVVFILILVIYFAGRKSGRTRPPKPLKFPTGGDGIPQDWSPTPDAASLYDAMQSDWYNPFDYGTNEQKIWSILEGKTKDQLAAIYNEFSNRYNEDLLQWFEDDLSGDDLSRALNYFTGVV